MEEEIKILENVLETKEYGLCEITDTFYKAIENLLKRYKELEQENKASKETINILTNKLEKVVDENNISEEEKRVLEAYRNYKEISGSNSWIICNPNTMWSEYFIPISVIQNKIDELRPIVDKYEKQIENDEETDLSYEEVRNHACKIEVLQELLEERNK